MRTRKLLSGLGATVMSLMMIIPWAVYADSPQTEDSSIVTESSAAEAMAEQGVIKEQKNSTQNTETDWVLFGCIGGGAVVVLIMIGLMAKKKIIHIRAAWAALFCWGDLLQSVLVNAVCTESVENHQVPLRDSTREIFFVCNFICYCTSL